MNRLSLERCSGIVRALRMAHEPQAAKEDGEGADDKQDEVHFGFSFGHSPPAYSLTLALVMRAWMAVSNLSMRFSAVSGLSSHRYF